MKTTVNIRLFSIKKNIFYGKKDADANSARVVLKKKNETWCGIKITSIIQIRNLQLILGEDTIVLTFHSIGQSEELIEIFSTLKFLFNNKKHIKDVLGVLLSPSLKIIKKKIKTELIDGFSKENLTAVLTCSNQEAYYNYEENFENLVGIELRYKTAVNEWFEENRDVKNILRVIREEKKKIIN